MDEDKIKRQIKQMAEAGCGGFFIHPRQGLTLPYLSREWFARVRLAVQTAQECGIEAWLYDEYPYPSGIAGGLLTANHPEFRERVLIHQEFQAIAGEPIRLELEMGRLVCALACPVRKGKVDWKRAVDLRNRVGAILKRELFWYWPMGHIPTNEKRFMADEGQLILEWEPPSGEWLIFTGVERDQRGFKYYDCFFDPLVPGAAQEFMALTHERYAAELGDYFGNVIPGIFTDETEPPNWSPQIEVELKKTCGYDFAQVLPALRRDDHPLTTQLRFEWRQTALRLFQERWENPIAQWCRDSKLIWGAEKPTWRASQFWSIAEPSTDAGHLRIPAAPEPLTADLRANHRAAIAAAEQSGGETVRCECFHSLGWGATLQDQKWAVDWLTVQGVNRITPHAFYATSSGLKKHDAAPSFFAENPYWPHFKLLADYTARLSLAMSTGREKARIAVLHPTATLWSGGKISRSVRASYEALQNELLRNHFQFHVVDAQALLNAQSVNGGLEIGNARYETVLVPPLIDVDAEIDAALVKAREAGLTIAGPLSADLLNIKRDLSIRDKYGAEIPAIWALWREADEQDILFFANTSGEAVTAFVQATSRSRNWHKWSLESGEISPFHFDLNRGESHFILSLPAYGSALLVGSSEEAEYKTLAVAKAESKPLSLDGQWEYDLDRPNALRLNRWLASSFSEDWSAADIDDSGWPVVEALPLCYLDQRGGGWVHQIDRKAGEVVWYRRHVQCDFIPENLEILVEDGAILGQWKLWINGTLLAPDAFRPCHHNGEDKTSASLATHFRLGENVIALQVQEAPETGGLCTPLHLIGDFALGGGNNRRLLRLPAHLPFHQLADSGFNHFSGVVTYRRKQNLGKWRNIEMPTGFGDVAQVWVNGVDLGVRAWSPYRWELPQTEGDAEIKIAVTNTLLPFLEGQVWDGTMTRPRSV